MGKAQGKEKIIEIKEKVKVGNVILEKGDKIKVLDENFINSVYNKLGLQNAEEIDDEILRKRIIRNYNKVVYGSSATVVLNPGSVFEGRNFKFQVIESHPELQGTQGSTSFWKVKDKISGEEYILEDNDYRGFKYYSIFRV
jgi:hypothetical protein